MTHTLHRQGTVESLSRDYPMVTVACHAVPESVKGAGPKIAKFLEIAKKNGAINVGDMKQGSIYFDNLDINKICDNVSDTTIAECVFDNLEGVKKTLLELKELDMGLPMVVSGLLEPVSKMLKEIGLEVHTVAQSLGVWGKTELLPRKEVLEITTMCGHHMVSPRLVEKFIDDIKKGKNTPEKAAKVLTKQCCCGIFNEHRTAELLRKACS